MSWKALPPAFGACLLLSWALNQQSLRSLRLDMDSLNAMTVFYLGRPGLDRMLHWIASSPGIFSSYEPITHFAYWLLYGPFGAEGPSGFRWLAVILQALDAILAGCLAGRMLGQRRWAALATLVYLLHPMHVNWNCAAIPHYLATYFILCGMLIHSGGGGVWPRAAGLGAAYLLAAFSKESGALLPLFVLCWDACAWLSERPSPGFWRRRLAPYLALSAVGLFYLWARWDLVVAPQGPALGRLWDALLDSGYAPAFPIALGASLLARRYAGTPFVLRVAFCAAWFAAGVLPFLGLLPVRLPGHVQGIEPRYLLLPMAGLACLAALVADLCARRWGSAFAVQMAFLSLVPSLCAPPRRDQGRKAELDHIAWGLARCADPGPNWDCVHAALSLPLARLQDPEAFARLAKIPARFWPRRRAEAFVAFFAPDPFDGAAPKWRCLTEARMEGRPLEACVAAEEAFARGNRELEAGRYASAAAAFDLAAASWPSFAEAFFQKARALSSLGNKEGAARSYGRALRCPMAYYLLPTDFLHRSEEERKLDYFLATRRTWLGSSPPRRGRLPADRLRRLPEPSPTDREALESLARIHQAAGDYKAAVRVLDRLVRDNPRDARYWSDRGVARALLKDAAALRDLERAIAVDPDLLAAYLTLGGLHAGHGRTEEALRVYEAGLRRPVRPGEPPEVRRLLREERDKLGS